MFTRVPSLVVIAGFATAFMFGCGESTTSPTSPSVTPSANRTNAATSGSASAAMTTLAAGGRGERAIRLFDACDPDSFNEVLGPGTCVRNGGIRFENFIELLRRH